MPMLPDRVKELLAKPDEMSAKDRHDSAAVCALVPALAGEPREVRLLGGGLTNRNFLVVAGGTAYVLRISSAGSGILGIDRDREVACLRAVAAAGVGAAVVASLRLGSI